MLEAEVVKMSLIPCGDDCIYQKDGYCRLEVPSILTNHKGGCVHYIKASEKPVTTATTKPKELQRPPEYF